MSLQSNAWERELSRKYAARMNELGFTESVREDCSDIIRTSLELMEHYNKLAMTLKKRSPKKVFG